MAAVPAAEEKDTGERRVLQEKPGLQTGPRRSGAFREQDGGAHRAEERGQRGGPCSSFEKNVAV